MSNNNIQQRTQNIILHNIKYLELLLNNTSFFNTLEEALALILKAKNKLVFSGVGKSWIIANKICASFVSTGTFACCLNPMDAMHGDLGVMQDDDVLICLSNSGNTEELVRLAEVIKEKKNQIIVITGNSSSTLARMSDVCLAFTNKEASLLGAPTTSCIISLLIGDILCILTYEAKEFGAQEYLALHPAGAIGAHLSSII
ncbi:Arabinose 5-phosphate isomerase KdsD [Rickettsiales endosymbiont of Paramecium tredecaurelia]|uniref:SIS domain-containing protein n=1 Tax=Candidatus Sarmatiella mevalonica TaxID=2770581 RepID=UPI001923D1F1|nr:SIS domain-containing protein [Candidatus Sarmatiella mevalonica]MBL3284267.1 Arabinose 5-phosphate isomerase KdsD [Candidatus Sarmatiella mevalonica]